MPRIVYLVTEDWAFYRHRLPMARAARDAGFDVHVIARVNEHRAQIEAEGFTLHAISWDRRSINPWAAGREVGDLIHLYRALKPDIVHHVAVKPVIFGSIAARLAKTPRIVNALVGLGYVFTSPDMKARLLREPIKLLLRAVLKNSRTRVIMQNRDDLATLQKLNILNPATTQLIRGSGIDIDHFQPKMEPPLPITLGFVARMLEDKGVRPLIAAQQKLQAAGLNIHLWLAGTPDSGNPATITEIELQSFATLPGITWLGHVEDVRDVWERCHIAIMPSRGEGLPKSLMEAAACARPLIATAAPGCREICVNGVNGILVPIDDVDALAAAIKRLAGDADLRTQYASAARAMVEGELSAPAVGASVIKLYREMLSQLP